MNLFNKYINFLDSKKASIVLVFVVFLVFIFSYFRVPYLFFQQDEILGFGLFIKEGRRIILSGLGAGNIRHFVPLTMALSYNIFNFFGMRYEIYNIMGLIFHLINGMLVYLIGRRILNKKVSAIIAVLIFFSSSVAAELIMWPVINLNSVSLTFSLVSWLIIIDEKIFPKIHKATRGLVVSLFFLLAIFSVEYSAGFILFIPALVFLTRKGDIKKKITYITPFVFVVLFYLLIRLVPIILGSGPAFGITDKTPLLVRVFNLITRYFGQLFLGQSAVLFLSNIVGKTLDLSEQVREVFVESRIFPAVAEIIGIILILFAFLIYKKLQKKEPLYSKNFLLTILLIIFSSLPFLFIPKEAGSFSVISSRYMYFGLTGMALFIAFINDIFIDFKKGPAVYLVTFLTLFIIIIGTFGNYEKANRLYSLGMLRLNILNSIRKAYVSLPKKVIFYTESDTSYYGLPGDERILPFQSGFGQTLLVFYSQEEKFPKEFYPGKYLWEITSQGYKETQGRGFGYFRDFRALADAIVKNDIGPTSVIAFRYDSATQGVEDMSEEVKGRLLGYFSERRELNQNSFKIVVPQYKEAAEFAIDGVRQTFWDSRGVPYSYPQTIEIDLGKVVKVAQVTIDTYNNRDQDSVGFSLALSNDKLKWREVFYAKRYPPNKKGFINMYISPQKTRFIRIIQQGYHKSAPWAIHELRIYEALE